MSDMAMLRQLPKPHTVLLFCRKQPGSPCQEHLALANPERVAFAGWTMNQVEDHTRLFRVRPMFLAGCAAVLVVLILPDAVTHSHILQRVLLLLAALAILAGCLLLLNDQGPKPTWRATIALITAVYLVASLPVFFFELSQVKWFMRHPWHSWLSMYARPWVHWGYIFVYLSVICSFLGRGRTRIAFITGSVLLVVLWQATGTWVF